MKHLRRLLLGIGILLATLLLAALAAPLYLGPLAKRLAESIGPSVLGAPVSVGHAHLSLLTGKLRLSDVSVGNPEGFETERAFGLGRLEADVNMATILSRVIVVRRLWINDPEVTLETGPSGSNIGRIMERLEKPPASEKDQERTRKDRKAKATDRKVVVDDLRVEGARVRVSFRGMKGQAMTIPAPSIHLTGVGRDRGGASPREIVAMILGEITQSVAALGRGLGRIVGSGADAVASGAKVAGQTAAQGLGQAAEAVGSLLGGGQKTSAHD